MYLKQIKKKLRGSKEIKNAGWILGGKIAQMAIAFFVEIWIARYLGPENYGEINYALVYVTFFAALSTLGINSIIIKEFIDHPNEQGEAIGTTIFLRLVSSILSEIMIIGIVNFINRGESITIAVVILCSFAIFPQVTDTINYWFQSRYLSKVVSVATMSAYFTATIFQVILLILQKDIRWFAFASTLQYMCMAFIMLMAYQKYGGPRFSVSIAKAKELLKKSHPFIIIWMSVIIYEQTDRIMLRQIINEAEVGFYSLAATVNRIGGVFFAAIIDSFSPTIMRCEKIDNRMFEKKNKQLYAFIIYVALLMSLALVCLGGIVIRFLYGDAYLGAVVPLKILGCCAPFSYLVPARNIWFIARGHQSYMGRCYVLAAITNVGMNVLLIPSLGASGAAMATLIAQIFAITVFPIFIKEMRPNAKLMLQALLLRDLK